MTTASAPRRLLVVGTLLGAMAIAYWFAHEFGLLEALLNETLLRDRIASFGLWGPFAIVALMTLAILVSPLPSAPIAVAAGAAYGHVWGTVYVFVGAEAGAIAAFFLSRFLGYDVLHRWFGAQLSVGWLGSQNKLMGIVFISRLIPFISFDLVSYAAGLTVLSFWRFAVATALGIVPASFLLAHLGDEMATGETEKFMISIAAIGALTLLPIVVKFFHDRVLRSSQRR